MFRFRPRRSKRRSGDCKKETLLTPSPRMLLLLCMAAAVLLTAVFPAAVLAEESERQTVRVGYYEKEGFEETAGEGAARSGYAYEYYLKLAEYTGWQYEYVYGNFSDLYEELAEGEIDLLAGLTWTQERAGMISYPVSPMGNEPCSLLRHDTDTEVTSDPSTLEGKRIGVMKGAAEGLLQEFLNSHNVYAEVAAYEDHDDLRKDFKDHEIDVLAVEGDGAYGQKHAQIIAVFGASDYYLCVNPDRPDLLGQLNEAQAQLLADEPGYLNELRTKYISGSIENRAFARAEKEWMEGHDSLKTGCLVHCLPYSDTDRDGNVTGMVTDILPEILEKLGIEEMELEWQGFENYEEMMAAAAQGSIDIAFPVSGDLYYAEENGFRQSEPIVTTAMELVYRGEYKRDKSARFAVNRNNRMQDDSIRILFPEAELVEFSSIEECLEAVVSGEADFTILNGLRADDILRNRQYRSLGCIQTGRQEEICLGVSAGNGSLLRLLNRGIRALDEDYALSRSYRYRDGLYTYTTADLLADNMGLFGAVLLGIFAMIIFFHVRDKYRLKKRIRLLEAVSGEDTAGETGADAGAETAGETGAENGEENGSVTGSDTGAGAEAGTGSGTGSYIAAGTETDPTDDTGGELPAGSEKNPRDEPHEKHPEPQPEEKYEAGKDTIR